MSIIKTIARNFLFPVIIYFKLEKLFSLFSQKNNLIIMYHGVVTKSNPALSVNHISVDNFETQIKYLASHFEIVKLEELFKEKNTSQNTKKKKIAITFDDGYENNYTHAFPILKKNNCPATIFIVTKGLVSEGHILWYDIIDILKNKIEIGEFKMYENKLPDGKRNLLRNVRNFDELKSVFKKLNTVEKFTILNPLIDIYEKILKETNSEFTKLLGSEQITEMISSGLIEFGSHTHNHPNLTELAESEAREEIMVSNKILESKTGQKINSIAFPDGSYNESTKKLSLQCGYINLLAVDYNLKSDDEDPFILPRFCISNTTTAESNIFQIHRQFNKKGF